MDNDELELVRGTIRGLVSGGAGADLGGSLDALGFDALLTEDRSVAIGCLFDELGRAGVVTEGLTYLVGKLTGGDPIVLPPFQASGELYPEPAGCDLGNGRIRCVGMGLGDVPHGRVAVVIRSASGRHGIARVDVTHAPLTYTSMDTVAIDATCWTVAGEFVCSEPLTDFDWPTAVTELRLALAHQQLGMTFALLASTQEYVTERIQFGRPIAVFQTVKHRLADVFVQAEATKSAVAAAWRAPTAGAAGVAKAMAGAAASAAAATAMQLSGGNGFTWEFGTHRHVRAAALLDALLGPSRELAGAIGREARRTCQVMTLGGLA